MYNPKVLDVEVVIPTRKEIPRRFMEVEDNLTDIVNGRSNAGLKKAHHIAYLLGGITHWDDDKRNGSLVYAERPYGKTSFHIHVPYTEDNNQDRKVRVYITGNMTPRIKKKFLKYVRKLEKRKLSRGPTFMQAFLGYHNVYKQ